MMAAHDTLTSALTSFVYRLAAAPDWQCALREELAAQNAKPDEPLPYDRLERLPLTEMAFKEAMRISPPVPSIPRRAVREFEFKGFRHPRFYSGQRQPALHPSHAGHLAGAGAVRSDALQRSGLPGPA